MSAGEIAHKLNIRHGITAVIGSGGKSTLISKLAASLTGHGSIIICTTTKIYIPEGIRTLIGPEIHEIGEALAEGPVICVGRLAAGRRTNEGTRQKLTDCAIPYERLAELADYVLVEADGAKGLPLKAHADYEPVIPKGTDRVLQVAGISGVGYRIADAVHRPELYASILSMNVQEQITPAMAAEVINIEKLCDTVIINQVETTEEKEAAAEMAKLLHFPVYIGALQHESIDKGCR